jgi:hypothetical protein
MMSKPDFNLLVPVDYEAGGKKKTRWVRFGSLWKSKDGNSYSGKVDFWPVGVDGNRVVLMPPKDSGVDPETGEIIEDEPAF